MRLQRSNEDETGGDVINISSLLDVMFILIIFFLATATFQEQERDVTLKLPDASDDMSLSSNTGVLIINVREDGSYFFGSRTMSLRQLQEALIAEKKKTPDQTVLVRGDARTAHGNVAAAVRVAKQVGFNESKFGYMPPDN